MNFEIYISLIIVEHTMNEAFLNVSKVTSSGTTTEFCIPDHWVQAAVMVKIRTFKLNPDLFRTTF